MYIIDIMDKVRLIAGRSNPELSKFISDRLGIPLTPVKYKEFGNTETYVRIEHSVRKKNVYIIQTGGPYEGRSINDHVMELFEIIDACKRSGVKSISVIVPTYPYARADKKILAHEAISASLFCKLLSNLGVTRIIAVDLHNPAIQGFTDSSFDNLYTVNLHIAHLKNTIFKGLSQEEINQQYVLCSPDAGSIKRTEMYAQKLSMEHVIMHKKRDHTQTSVVLKSQLIGDPELLKNRFVLVPDDIVDTAGTLCAAGDELKKYGIKGMIVVATHGVFSHPAFDRINQSDMITKVIVTNTLPQEKNKEKTNKLEIVDTSELFATVISRIQTGGSVSELFD